MTATALLLGVALVAQQGSPTMHRTDDGYLVLYFPAGPLQEKDIQRRLLSGLTATIELTTKVKVAGRGDTLESLCLLDIRHEVWEEMLLVRRLDATGAESSHSFKSFEQLSQWLSTDPIRVALVKEFPAPMNVKIACRIIPFSKGEEGDTRDWFSKLLNVPDPARLGRGDRNRQPSIGGEPSSNSIFSSLMSTGIERQSVRDYSWEWTAPPRLNP
ncbi:MAG: hypothetical protein AB1714_25580 [Acidobacteriota bacterium]